MIESISRDPGTYLLHLILDRAVSITIGRLGRFKFNQGSYYYVGSAFGPGGLRARLRHHAKVSERPHWHIDYLRSQAILQAVWVSRDGRHLEHQWAEKISTLSQILPPVAGFGASDCACDSHLFYSAEGHHEWKITKYLQQLSDHVERITLI